ncbi:hypothetical protein TM233_67420 [Bradyrhizobium sp. TM233]|nr:hypothetical protein TM233_67420 [Bradyrhizobium sp. TM233]
MKSELKRWNSEVFGDLRLKRAETVQKINELDRKEEEGGLSTEELGVRQQLLSEFWAVLTLSKSSF